MGGGEKIVLKNWVFAVKKACMMVDVSILSVALCGRSSVVERHVANVNVVSSNLIARFTKLLIKDCR